MILFVLLASTARSDSDGNSKRQLDTALFEAVKRDDPAAVKSLLTRGADPNARDEYQSTPLICAAENADHNAVDIARLLLSHGADIRAADKKESMALHWAAFVGKSRLVELLLARGAPVDARDNGGRTALSWAACFGHREAVMLLLKHGADANGQEDVEGETCLMGAAEAGDLVTLKMLLDHGAKVNVRDQQGGTALMYAATRYCAISALVPDEFVQREFARRNRLVRLLIERGADVNVADRWGDTALRRARRDGNQEAIALLKKAGARE